MAQVISHYTGVVSGGATIYCYSSASNTSAARRVYAGDSVRLPADYASHGRNGMLPTDSPSGWMYYYNISNVTPSYKTVTDPCTPPESVTLSGKTLTISGGAGGDLNTLTGWGVSWRDRSAEGGEWGEWSEEIEIAEPTLEVDAEPGQLRQFRARTLGSAGETYFSDYVLCETLLSGNEAAGTPTILLPAPGAVARCHTPAIKVICAPDPDGDDLRLMRSIDGGEWTAVAHLTGAGDVVYDRLPWLEEGEHSVSYHSRDAADAQSGSDSIRFSVRPARWSREITRGTVISSPSVSHRSDIAELLEAVNTQRRFYDLPPVSLPGEVGRFSDWQQQMLTLGNAVDEICTVTAQPLPTWPAIDAYPSAAAVNFIRQAVEE